MKVYLDDERQTPEGWVSCLWPDEVIQLLKEGLVEEISLDHDLGCKFNRERTGYDVLLWIEESVFFDKYLPPKINIHTANVAARLRMEALVTRINNLVNLNRNNKK